MQRIRPADLIKTVIESKIAQKNATAKLEADKKRQDQLKVARKQRKWLKPPNFSSLNNDSILTLEHFMAVSPFKFTKINYHIFPSLCHSIMGKSFAMVS